MLKTFLVAAAFAAVFLVGSCGGSFKSAGKRRNEATVAVTVVCEGRDVGSGSGVVIGERYVLTAAHVTQVCPGQEFEIVTVKDERYKAVVDRVLPGADLARLRIEGDFVLEQSPVTRVGSAPRIEDEICFHSGAPSRDIRCGRVEEIQSSGAGNVKHSAVVEPGNSGSPVFNKRGELIGIITHYYRCQNGQSCGGRFSSLWDRDFILTEVQ